MISLTKESEIPAYPAESKPVKEISPGSLDKFDQELSGMTRFLDETLVLAPLVEKLDEWFPAIDKPPIITEAMIDSELSCSRAAKLRLRRKFRKIVKNYYQQIFTSLKNGNDLSKIETVENRLNLKRANVTNNALSLANKYGGFMFFDMNNPVRREVEDEIGSDELMNIRAKEITHFGASEIEDNPMQDYLKNLLGEELFTKYASAVFRTRAISAAKKSLGAKHDRVEMMPRYGLVTKEEVQNILEILEFTRLAIVAYQVKRGKAVDPEMTVTKEDLIARAEIIASKKLQLHPELDIFYAEVSLFMGQRGFEEYLKLIETKRLKNGNIKRK